MRLRIVRYLPWLSAPDIAVGAHIPGGAMVVPELPEREPDLTPPWMWNWWEDGGGTGVTAPADRGEGHASTAKVSNDDGTVAHTDADEVDVPETGDEDETTGGLGYWENKQHHLDDQFATPHSTAPSGDEPREDATATCWPLPVTASMWMLPVLKGVCVYDAGASSYRHPSGTWPGETTLHYELPARYEPTRSRKDMREYCIPAWETARTLSWSRLASMIDVGAQEEVPGLFWSEKGFVRRAMMYALATIHSFRDLVDAPDVFSQPCALSAEWIDHDFSGLDLFNVLKVVVDQAEFGFLLATVGNNVAGVFDGSAWGSGEIVFTGDLTVSASSSQGPAGAVTFNAGFDSGSHLFGFTWNYTIRMTHAKVINAALADYHFWWAWRLYSYGMDTGDANALAVATCAAKSALAEICEIASCVLHEYTHIHGGLFEDREADHCSNCCHYLSQWTFLNRLLAKNALPFPEFHFTSRASPVFRPDGSSPAGRFDFGDAGWIMSRTQSVTDHNCDSTWTASHESFWIEADRLTVGWSVPKRLCWETIGGLASTDTANFPTG